MKIIEKREEKLGRITIGNNNKINEEYEDQNKKSSKKNTIKKNKKTHETIKKKHPNT